MTDFSPIVIMEDQNVSASTTKYSLVSDKRDSRFFEDLIATLKRRLAETEQYLAVAEGQADGGPPGWEKTMPHSERSNHWVWSGYKQTGIHAHISRKDPAGFWTWCVWKDSDHGETLIQQMVPTAREAMAAAEAAYQKAISNGASDPAG